MSVYRILLGLLITGCLAISAVAAPKVVFTPDTFSWGKILQHSVLTKRVWIKSVGDQPARITEATPDCGCTDLFLRDSLVKPKDSVPLDIVMHTRAFIGFTEKRPFVKIEGSDEKVTLKLYAEILMKPENFRPLSITPVKVDVSQYSEKPRRKGTFTITNSGSSDYVITVVDSSAKDFSVVLPNKIKAGEKLEGQVIVSKDAITRSFEESFTFEITDDGRSRFSVPIWRQYQPTVGSSTPTGK